MTTRRTFVQLAAMAAGAAYAGSVRPAAASGAKKILVLGGTGLIGPHLVAHAVARGHQVTLFNRGKTNADLFPDLERLKGDRNADLGSIEAEVKSGRRWDAVVDNSASIPRWVTASAGLLAKASDRYLYTSSISAYANQAAHHTDETAPVAQISKEDEARVKTPAEVGEHYGPLKARCEAEAQAAFGPERTCVVRPGLIVGPGDSSDRFTYWPVRIARGGEVMAPGNPDDPVQFVDARDLGEWYVRLVESRTAGVFNAVGPRATMSVAGMLHGIRAVVDNDIRFTWVDAAHLEAHKVEAWMHMTVWVPPDSEYGGLSSARIDRALAAGLTFRPLADTARDTLAWWRSLPEDRRAQPRAGCPEALEKETLAAWHLKRGTAP